MGTIEREYGGARYRVLTADVDLTYYEQRVQTFKNTSGIPYYVRLPSVTGMNTGGPLKIIINDPTSTSNVRVALSSGAGSFDLLPGRVAVCSLASTSTSDGTWAIRDIVLGSGRLATRSRLTTILSNPATCNPATAMIVQCRDATKVRFIDRATVIGDLGGVVLVDGECWRVYTVRASGQHAQEEITIDASFDSCTECLRGTGYTGDGDDSPYDITDLDNGTTSKPVISYS
jgi:hypothetical protein